MGEEEPKSKPVEQESNPSVVVHVETETDSAIALSVPKPSWFTPKRLLVLFCVINLINYLDRGAIASNGVNGHPKTCTKNGTCTAGSGIQGDFNLTNFQDGVISSAFMVGLLVASPVFASSAHSVNPFRLIGVGLTVWTIATAGCGFSFNFWSIAVCRMFVGVGEASFISLAAPYIDDNAPAAQKTAWLGIFYMCIPSGVALGYVYGGLVANHLSWRWAFWGEAILMVSFAILGFVMKPLPMKGFSPAGSSKALESEKTDSSKVEGASNGSLSVKDDSIDQSSKIFSSSKCESTKMNPFSIFLKDMKVLLLDKVYVVNVLGYIAYNFVVGAYSYWGPKAGYSIYHMTNADMFFGGITVVCGIVGTLAGGYALDLMTATLSNAFKLLSVSTLFGGIFCFAAFCLKNMYGFLVLFAVGEILVFATQGPVNYVCLHSVKPSIRPLAMAMSTVLIHILGDVPSSPLVGVLQDHLNDWRKTTLILTAIFFIASVIWFIGIFLHSVDKFNKEDTVSEKEKSTTKPLPEEKTTEATESAAKPLPEEKITEEESVAEP